MATEKTPGVYVQEISTLPPSVVQVSTAIPAFIGYTEKGPDTGKGETVKIARINTLLEYEDIFGKAKSRSFNIAYDTDNSLKVELKEDDPLVFLMYYGVSLYFKNGGGSCYIVSVSDYTSTAEKADFEKSS